MDRRTPDQPMLPIVFGLLQDLEDRDRRRQHLHVAAGRADDFADRGTRRRVHDLAGGWQRTTNSRGRVRYRRPAQFAPTRRSPAPDRHPAGVVETTLRVPPDLADTDRPLSGAPD